MRPRLFTLSLALGLSAPLAAAQDAVADARPAKPETSENFHRDSEIRGMDLWSAEDADGERADIGDINDFVVNARTGAISHVVISSGGLGSVGDTLRALPWADIRWSENEDGERTASIDMSEDAFQALKGFDEKDLDKLVGKKAVEANAERLKDASKDLGRDDVEDAAKGLRESAGVMATNHLCSDLTGLDVFGPGEDEAFTSIGSLVFDCDNAAVAFVTLEANDEEYLVPFSTLAIRPIAPEEGEEIEDADDVEYAAHAPRNEAGMKGAPTIDEDEKRTAMNPRFRAEVYAHYEMKGPKYPIVSKADGAYRRSDG